MTDMTTPTDSQDTAADPQMAENEGSPLDAMISTVDSYMRDPKLITPETLGQLKADLIDLKSYVDGGPSDSGSDPYAGQANDPAQDNSGHGLAITIGKMRGGR